jgi:4-hydroxy-3-methylbut-2-en-1-yl diphosphate synthase IspG/GcpE
MQETTLPSDVDQITPLMTNYDQLVRVGQNIGCLDSMIEEKYTLIRDAVRQVKMGGETLQAAVVCRVNMVKYPDEVMAKIS